MFIKTKKLFDKILEEYFSSKQRIPPSEQTMGGANINFPFRLILNKDCEGHMFYIIPVSFDRLGDNGHPFPSTVVHTSL